MERRSVEAIVQALNDAGVRYLIAGGLAVVAHGFVRFTADLDLVLDLEEGNLRRALSTLAALGYRPRAPVALDDFVDPSNRSRWVAEKGLTVFSLSSDRHPATEVDVFVEAPFDFDAVHARRATMEVADGLQAPFVGALDLIDMKRRAGRPQDLQDVERLESLKSTPPEREE